MTLDGESAKVRCALLRYLIPDLTHMVLEYCWPSEIVDLNEICLYGNYEKILEYISFIFNDEIFWDMMFKNACGAGYKKVIKLMMDRGEQAFNIRTTYDDYPERDKYKNTLPINDGFENACLKGHLDIVEWMIKKGADNWNGGLFGACQGGYMEIIKLMIEKGANSCEHKYSLPDCLYRKIMRLKLNQ